MFKVCLYNNWVPNLRPVKYFCSSPIFLGPWYFSKFSHSQKKALSGKPCLVNILRSIVPSLTKLCRMEDKHVLSMTEPLNVYTSCPLIFYKALDLEKKCKIPKRAWYWGYYEPTWYQSLLFFKHKLLLICANIWSLYH